MIRRPWLLPWVCLLALVSACSSSPPPDYIPGGGTDAGNGGGGTDTGSAVTCAPGMILCSGNQRYECDTSGNIINQSACPATAPNCYVGLGCRACQANSTRCNPTNGAQIQSCRADGSGWDNGTTCNGANGQTCNNGACTDRCSDSALGRSYLGCDYWPTVTVNSQLDAQFTFAVVLSNPQTYPVQATISGGALPAPMSVTLAPGSVQVQTLPWVDSLIEFDRSNPGCMGISDVCAGNTPGRSVLATGGAYHVHSNGPIAAYQFNPLQFERSGGFHSFTNDASLLLPQGVLTQHYLVSTYPNWNANNSGTYLGGFVAITAVTGESTTVTVHLTATVSPGHGVTGGAAGSTQVYHLQVGDVVQLVGTGDGDLTGTVIQSDQPVAVFVGHDCTNVPPNRPACDHLEQQLLPNETWGRDYLVSALRDRGPTEASVVRIVSQHAGNAITFDPPSTHPAVTLGAGQMLEFATTSDFHIVGSQAFLVTQYMIGQGDATSTTGGDPAMVLEVPSQQFRSSYDFYVPQTYTSSFINIVAPAGATLNMDHTPVRGSASTVGSWTIYHLPITAGAHHLESAAQQAFGIKVYGIALYTSYMYPGGLDLREITPG